MGDADTVLCSTSSPAPPRSRAADRGVEFFCEEAAAAPRRRHSLDACSLCRRPLGRSRDIYMYRGDTPFCSEDCRQEQIDLDLAGEEEAAGHRRRSRRAHASPSSGPASAAAEAVMAS